MKTDEIATLRLEFEAELKKMGISQQNFCERVGVTRQGVSKWKNTGKYPKWLPYALAGLPILIKNEKKSL